MTGAHEARMRLLAAATNWRDYYRRVWGGELPEKLAV